MTFKTLEEPSSLSSSFISSAGFCVIIPTPSPFSSLPINFSPNFVAVKNGPHHNLSEKFSAN
ncbi:hypothetical protein SDJN02_07254 [Cucurbita argyrosperma subsp. argyrosperma]|nr:hypothetical protein SDJN02_07254 [Cucurbita argyrosperma subsp. argyrosperma]